MTKTERIQSLPSTFEVHPGKPEDCAFCLSGEPMLHKYEPSLADQMKAAEQDILDLLSEIPWTF